MIQYPAVGIGLLSWNSKSYLEKFLPALQTITYPAYTIYVIDNGSIDDSADFLKAYYPSVKIITIPNNLGVAGGYNFGFARIAEEYVVMLNSDVEVTDGFLEPLVELMQTDSQIAVCQSKLLSYTNKERFEYGGAAGGMIDCLGYSFCRGRIFGSIEKDNGQYKTSEIFWAGGACCLIRKSVYQEIGGMYEYYGMHFEEVDLCWRLHTYDYKVMYCNESTAYHLGGGTLSYYSPKKTFYNFRNNLIMCIRNSPALFLVWWLPLRFCMDQLSILKFLFQTDFKNALSVVKAYFSLLYWLFSERNKFSPRKKSLLNIPVVLKKSIIWLYFIQRTTVYSSIKARK
jgi:GT2 family glycosyltransferase